MNMLNQLVLKNLLRKRGAVIFMQRTQREYSRSDVRLTEKISRSEHSGQLSILSSQSP
jgi:hypothetical protein